MIDPEIAVVADELVREIARGYGLAFRKGSCPGDAQNVNNVLCFAFIVELRRMNELLGELINLRRIGG